MGVSILAGGARNGVQSFDRRNTGNHAILLILAVLALVVPSLFSSSMPGNTLRIEEMSLAVSVVMIVLYGLGLFYSLKFAQSPITYEAPPEEHEHPGWSMRTALIVLALATAGVVVMSELLVGAVNHVVENLGLSEFFLGIILIPIVGNVAEHLVAVQVAIRNQMDLSVEIAVSSSLQIALFVAPLLVFISLAMGHPLTLIFNSFELMALGAAVLVAAFVSWDGESNWLEGAALSAVYLILGIGFFLLPA
jgi:Ca2+:H+ antiporter